MDNAMNTLIESEKDLLELAISSMKYKYSDWVISTGGWKIENEELGIAIWTSNVPIFDTNFHPEPLKLSLYDKYRLYKQSMNCINEIRKSSLIEKVKKINKLNEMAQ